MDRRKVVLAVVGGGLFSVGLLSLVIAILWDPGDHEVDHVFREAFVAIWPFCFTVAAAILVYERWLRDDFVAELKRLSGPQLIQALRPRVTLQTLLDHVYGDKPHNRDVVIGVLGGYGEAADRSDLSISDETAVTLTLADTDEPTEYNLTITADYTFEGRPVHDDTFIFFLTSDPAIRDSLVVACDRPLFDYWYFPGSHALPDLDDFKESVVIELEYEDTNQVSHWSTPTKPALEEIPTNQWMRYLRVFREPVGTLRRLEPKKFEPSFAILTFRFADLLTDVLYLNPRVRRLRVTSTTRQQKADGYCYWTATYPCLVTAIEFETSALSDASGQQLRFRKAPFLLRADSEHDTWVRNPLPLKPETWLLPGHGVSLMWRADGQ
jgi:hypothetical protein